METEEVTSPMLGQSHRTISLILSHQSAAIIRGKQKTLVHHSIQHQKSKVINIRRNLRMVINYFVKEKGVAMRSKGREG